MPAEGQGRGCGQGLTVDAQSAPAHDGPGPDKSRPARGEGRHAGDHLQSPQGRPRQDRRQQGRQHPEGENNLDVLTVMVEVDEKYFSDEIRKLDGLKNKVGAVLKQALGVSVRVKLVEPKTIQRSEGKAKRVIDNREL